MLAMSAMGTGSAGREEGRLISGKKLLILRLGLSSSPCSNGILPFCIVSPFARFDSVPAFYGIRYLFPTADLSSDQDILPMLHENRNLYCLLSFPYP
ncbi:hypothetical protein AGR1C_Cc50049 [Agrobacterium fabacearum TT111]|nr:hypothetical protein AGR1C_Cc50049 [Agrobacterium fabacearum TT111]